MTSEIVMQSAGAFKGRAPIKRSTIREAIYIALNGQESLLIKVRGRGWFISSGGNMTPGLTPDRLDLWLEEGEESFERALVDFFHFIPKS